MRFSNAALACGAAAGVALAAWALFARPPETPANERAAAHVNGRAITRAAYARLLETHAAEMRGPLTPALRRRVLQRMVDEELLVQRALALGFAASDRRVRAGLTNAMIRTIIASAENKQPSETELQRFYEQQREYFAQPGRMHVQQVFVRAANANAAQKAAALKRAQLARAQLQAGAPLAKVRARFGDEAIPAIPNTPLPPLKLREYLGPKLARAAAKLSPGEASAPQLSPAGYHVLALLSRLPSRVPPLGEIRAQVQAEWRRRAGERALRAYLLELRAAAEITFAENPQ